MGSVTVDQAYVSPIGLPHSTKATAYDRRRSPVLAAVDGRNAIKVHRDPFTVNECDATSLTEPDHAEPGRRPLGLAGPLRYATHMLMDARHVDPELRAATAKGAGLLYDDGEVDAAHRVLVTAIDRSWSRPDHDIPGVVEALHALGVVCYFGDRAELWVPFQRRLDYLGDMVPPVLRLISRTCQDPVTVSPAALLEVDRHIDRLRAGDPDPAQTVLIGMAAHVVDRLPDCRDELLRVFLEAGEKCKSDWTVRAGLLLAIDAVGAGQWAEAQTLAELCIGLCETSGQRLWAWSGRYVLALVAARGGQWSDCRALTNDMVEWATPRGVLRLVHDAQHVGLVAALDPGDHDDDLSGAGAVVTRQGGAATTHPSELAGATMTRLSPRLALRAASAEALVAPDELAAELFQAALDIPGIERWPFEVARVQLAFGERLRRRQATRASRDQLAAALDTFTRLGARTWADRASTELRATGQTRRRPGSGSPIPLTPQELGIAELAATGLTNKQIGARLYLSPRTVSAHLYRIFPKLGITSRAALRDALRALPPTR